MDLNFELILTIIFLLAGAFWLLNKFVVKQEEGLIEFAGSLAPVLGLVLVLRSFLIEPFQIPSQSMVPTLKVGDFILVSKWTYGIRLPVLRTKIIEIDSPERGDVMVFFPPHEDRYFIKRLVGLPGDKVQVVDGVLYVNDQIMKFFAEINREIITEGLQVLNKGVIFHKAYSYISKLDLENSFHVETLLDKADDTFLQACDLSIEHFTEVEEYEKCLFIKKFKEPNSTFLYSRF